MEMFCKEYTVDFNGSRAAIAAGYSKRGARVRASEMLTRRNIQEAIQKLIKERGDRIEKSGDAVVRLLWKMAELDLADYLTVGEGGEVQAIPFDSLTEGATKLISKIKEKRTIVESSDGAKQTMYGTLEYELPEKTKCLEMLGRHYGIFNDKFNADDSYVLPVKIIRETVDGTKVSINRPAGPVPEPPK